MKAYRRPKRRFEDIGDTRKGLARRSWTIGARRQEGKMEEWRRKGFFKPNSLFY
jgi:hypothetical protein